jgi:hypothetical protein
VRRRTARLLALALVVLGAAVLASPGPAAATPATQTAWWWRPATTDPVGALPPAAQVPGTPRPTLPAAPPAPPTVPEGHLLVEGTIEGATAVAALTWTLTEGESAPILTVTPAESSAVPPEAVILACRAALPWDMPESQPGPWDKKPLVDCGLSVQGIPSEDGTITFPLGPLVSGTTLDVVLVPGRVGEPTPAGQPGSAFSLSFDAVEGASLATSGGGGTDFGGSGDFTPPAGTGSGSFATPGSFTPAPSTPAAPPAVSPATPALEPQEQAPSVPRTAMPTAALPVPEDTTGRTVAFVILLAGSAIAAWTYLSEREGEGEETSMIGLGRFRRAAPAAATVGGVPEPVTGGLGRFARSRTGPPPALS